MKHLFKHVFLLWIVNSCTGSMKAEKLRSQRQVDGLQIQIQRYERLLLVCRGQVENSPGQAQKPAIMARPTGFGNWGWIRFKKDRRSFTARRTSYTYWGYNLNQLRNKLSGLIRDYNECMARLQAQRAAQDEVRARQQQASTLLGELEASIVTLKRCVGQGGTTSADISTLERNIAGAGIIVSEAASQRVPDAANQRLPEAKVVPTNRFPFWWIFDDKRRAVTLSPSDMSRLLSQRQQWNSYIKESISNCWASIGHLPDGSLPITTTNISSTTTLPSSMAVYSTFMTGPGLTTTFAPLLTVTPC